MPRLTELQPICRNCAHGHAEPCRDLFELPPFGLMACWCETCEAERECP